MPSALPCDLAVFDIAGTTVEEHQAVYVALEQAVRAAGVTPSAEEVTGWMGADKREAIADALGASVHDASTAAVYDDFRARLGSLYATTPPTPLPGVGAAIATLRAAGVAVALTTGFSRDVTDDVLGVIGWTTGVVDTVVCAEEVGAGRPAPYMIFEAMRRTATVDVRRVLVAGDTQRDLLAGYHAGAGTVIGVLTGAQDRATLAAVAHTHLLGSVRDVPQLLGCGSLALPA